MADPVKVRRTVPPFSRYADKALWLSSARAGIYYLVETLRPGTVWMPSYLCVTMIESIAHRNSIIRFYPVDGALSLSDLAWLKQVRMGDIACVIDYFGYHSPIEMKRAVRAAGAWVLEDACQALMTDGLGEEADYLLFSPRKFLGVPDGGVLVPLNGDSFAKVVLDEAPARWWLTMFGASLLRREFDRRGGDSTDRRWFELFREADANAPQGAFAISSLSKALLFEAFDYDSIAERRRANYRVLWQRLAPIALLPVINSEVVPLGFVIRLKTREERDRIRHQLIAQNIYPPVHWPIHKVVPERFVDSHRLCDTIMTLPCDQRYDESDMQRVSDLVCKNFKPYAERFQA